MEQILLQREFVVFLSGSALSNRTIQPEQTDGTQSRMTTTA